jgi:hypothetical protein
MLDGDIASFERWVAANSGRSARSRARAAADSASAAGLGAAPHLVSLATAAGEPPLVSHSLLVGTNAGQALTQDQAVEAARRAGGADSQPARQALAASPATGCAMVLTLAQRASGFNPASPAAPGNVDGYLAFVGQVLLCPAFAPLVRDQVAPGMSGDWTSVVEQIASYYVGLAPQQLAEIRVGL